jgi:hypothetical protein
MNSLQRLEDKQRQVLLGTSLSQLFTKWPLWLNHPANISAFYGILVSLSLILPYAFGATDNEAWLEKWVVHSAFLVVACSISGFASTLIVFFSKRFPVQPPRAILYPMPFVGLALITIDRTGLISLSSFVTFIWMFLLFPGPLYVHLSWAPRHRLLCMIEDGKNPFAGLEAVEDSPGEFRDAMTEQETELIEVIEAFDSEEE